MIRNTTDAGLLKPIGLPTYTIFELDKVGCATLFEAPASEPAQSKTPKVREFNVTIVTGGVLSALPNGTKLWKKNILRYLVEEGATGIRGVGYNKVYMYDVAYLSDPRYHERLRRHVGFHPDIIKGVVLSDGFEEWLNDVLILIY